MSTTPPIAATQPGVAAMLYRISVDEYERMVAVGLGDLDKSGIAELTFKDRHQHSGDHV